MQICFIKDGTALTLPVTPARRWKRSPGLFARARASLSTTGLPLRQKFFAVKVTQAMTMMREKNQSPTIPAFAFIKIIFLPHAVVIKNVRSVRTQILKIKNPPKTQCFRWILVSPAGFEPVAYRVGVIRRSNGKPLGANGFVGFGQIFRELQKIPGGVAPQCLREFFR